MLKRILVIAFLIISSSASAQLYPIEIRPGETKTIESGADTLWILKDSQVKKAILAAKKLQVEEEITKELKKKISLIEEKDLIKDSLIIDLKKDRDFYLNNWKDCTNDVDLLIAKCRRQKLYTRLSMAGIAVAFIAGFFIAK
jgi:hypothetical protein